MTSPQHDRAAGSPMRADTSMGANSPMRAGLDGPRRTYRFGDTAARSADTLALQVACGLGVLVAMLCLVAAGSATPLWLVVVLPVVALAAAGAADSHLPLAALLAVALTWAYGMQHLGVAAVVWALPAGAGLLVSHVTAALLASAPPATRWARPALARHGLRMLVVLAATAVLAGACLLVGGIGAPGVVVVTAAALGALVAFVWWGRARDDRLTDEPPED